MNTLLIIHRARSRLFLATILSQVAVIFFTLIAFGFACPLAQGQCVNPPDGMVGWWPGDNSTADIVGGNDGNYVNSDLSDYAPGFVDQAFEFDNHIPQYVEVPHADAFSFGPTEPMTIDFWAFPTEGTDLHIVGKRESCTSGGINYQIFRSSHGDLSFASDNGGVTIAASSLFPNDTWTHIACTFDFDSTLGDGTFKIYIDGELQGTGTGLLGAENTAPLKIGLSGTCTGFGGLLDEVQIFDRALSQEEIQTIYQAGSDGVCKVTLVLTGVVSRKTHGSAGDFDLSLVLNSASEATVEPRTGGPTQVIFTFSDNVMASDGMIDANEFTITNASFGSASIAENILTLNLTDVIDQSIVTIAVNGIESTGGGSLNGDNDVEI